MLLDPLTPVLRFVLRDNFFRSSSNIYETNRINLGLSRSFIGETYKPYQKKKIDLQIVRSCFDEPMIYLSTKYNLLELYLQQSVLMDHVSSDLRLQNILRERQLMECQKDNLSFVGWC